MIHPVHRQFDGKAGSLADGAFNEDPSAVGLDDFLGDGQSESGGTGFDAVDVPLREAFEEMVADFRGNAGAGVAHLEAHRVSAPALEETVMVPPLGV